MRVFKYFGTTSWVAFNQISTFLYTEVNNCTCNKIFAEHLDQLGIFPIFLLSSRKQIYLGTLEYISFDETL